MIEINHFGDCSIYALNCNICDCGEFRRIMPEINMIDEETMKLLVAHQVQVREFAYKLFEERSENENKKSINTSKKEKDK